MLECKKKKQSDAGYRQIVLYDTKQVLPEISINEKV